MESFSATTIAKRKEIIEKVNENLERDVHSVEKQLAEISKKAEQLKAPATSPVQLKDKSGTLNVSFCCFFESQLSIFTTKNVCLLYWSDW